MSFFINKVIKFMIWIVTSLSFVIVIIVFFCLLSKVKQLKGAKDYLIFLILTTTNSTVHKQISLTILCY